MNQLSHFVIFHDYSRPRRSQLEYMVSTWIAISSEVNKTDRDCLFLSICYLGIKASQLPCISLLASIDGYGFFDP